MALARWRPMHDMASFQNEMNQLFSDFFQNTPSRGSLLDGVWNPATDVSETEKEFTVRFELPGISPENVNISLTDNVLSIKGEKKEETEDKKRNYHRTECCYGSFQRTFALPTDVDADQIHASFKHGVLHITIPKAEAVKPKEIKVDVE